MDKQRGFNLLECVVALAILGMLAGMAAPDVGDMIHAQRPGTVTNDVLQQLQLARSEAIKRNRRVALCKSSDGVACTDAGNWDRGWILFEDANNSGTREEGEPLLERLLPIPPGYRLTANAPLARYVSYSPFGHARLTSNAFRRARSPSAAPRWNSRRAARSSSMPAGGRGCRRCSSRTVCSYFLISSTTARNSSTSSKLR
ncbi:prepilin-type N-terminal cleavage/methylation domain-containing protein [Ramlibacter terrae]|uniref:Type II secretion system protein H n=1 Tax=Ramlibacter terrae TaxID=2732511 RepID=A0ABX6P488_9BURK|nr:prepilin-type N-terminal cleavage/methylation domain-containing protein [Ramlibacter terrae]